MKILILILFKKFQYSLTQKATAIHTDIIMDSRGPREGRYLYHTGGLNTGKRQDLPDKADTVQGASARP